MAVPANRNLRITTGVLLVLAGLASIVFPFISALALTIGFGAVAVVAGVSQLLRLGAAGGSSARLFRLLSALLYLGGGVFVLLFPLDSSFSLTLFIGALLVVEAVMELAAAATAAGPARATVLLDGVVTAILGVLVLAEWPSDTLWVIGTLFGVALFLSAFRMFAPADQAST
ncbi:MAG: DUF308 domain-containing protein [Synechococcus sp.]|nr:DUF308 domain-containing protein [Synechococcus sp.]